MSHKTSWRGFVAAAALFLTTPPAFSQEKTVMEIPPPDAFYVTGGEFGPSPGCPFPPGGRPPFPHLPPGGPHFGAAFMMPPPPFAQVDLTDDQVARLAKLKRSFDSGNSKAFATLRSLENEMRDKLSADNINDSDISKLAEEIAQQKAELSKRFSAHILASAKILTAEQRKKIRLAEDRMELGPLGGFGKTPPPPMPAHPPAPGT